MLNYAVSVTDPKQAIVLGEMGEKIVHALKEYERKLEKILDFKRPRGIVFHDLQSATALYSNSPLPAYTSRDLIHISPDPEVWRSIFLSATNNEAAINFYQTLGVKDISIIAAHELTHHAQIFSNLSGEENMWFEEGLCFYLPRKIMLHDQEFHAIQKAESILIEEYRGRFGEYGLSQFGESGDDSYAGAFYDYWRSTYVIEQLIEHYFNDVEELFDVYQQWQGFEPIHEYLVNTLKLKPFQIKEWWLT